MRFTDFTQVDLSGFEDNEPVWDNYQTLVQSMDVVAAGRSREFAVGEKPAGFNRQWTTVGEARREVSLPTRDQFYSAVLNLHGDEMPW